MHEIWKDIIGYEGKYQISNTGKLKSVRLGILMKPMKCTNGYLSACLWKNNKQKKILMHRLVATHFIKNPNNYSDVNHLDENKENNNVDNLEWCSHLYNMNYGNVKRKIREASFKRVWTKEQKMRISNIAKGRIWIHKEKNEKLIYPYEYELYKNNQWVKGRKKEEV